VIDHWLASDRIERELREQALLRRVQWADSKPRNKLAGALAWLVGKRWLSSMLTRGRDNRLITGPHSTHGSLRLIGSLADPGRSAERRSG
jgi:hypothetical protein